MNAPKSKRKTRSDKKRDVKPVIPLHLKKVIYSLSEILGVPVKDIAEIACMEGIQSKRVVGYLSTNFKRDARLANTIYFGSPENVSLQPRMDKSIHERITIKFTAPNFEDVALLAYALDVTPSRAVALLLAVSISTPDMIHTLLRDHSRRVMDDEDKQEFKKIMKYLNANNMFKESIDWKEVLSYLGDFVVNGWRKE